MREIEQERNAFSVRITLGAFLACFEPRGMPRTLFAMAVVQALVPLIAMTWVPENRFSPGYVPVMGLNAVFVALWIVSALLFRHAAGRASTITDDVQRRAF